MPGLVVEVHLDQHVAREELPLRADLGAALDLDDLLGGNQDLLEPVGQALLLGLLADRAGDLFLEAGIDVDHIPAACHRPVPSKSYCPSPKMTRTPNENI